MGYKIVLVYPDFPSPLTNPEGFNMPLSLLHLGTYLRHQGYEVCLVDAVVEQKNFYPMLQKELADAQLVGISAMTAQLPMAMEIVDRVKQRHPTLTLVMGGVHATLFTEQVIAHPLVDYAIVGEGEIPMTTLADHLSGRNATDLKAVAGLAHKLPDGGAHVNKAFARFDYNAMPPIDYSLLNPSVLKAYSEYEYIYFPLMTVRGCPHHCTFCINVILPEYRKWLAWTPQRTVTEIERILKYPKKGGHKITFFDENTFASTKRIRDILDLVRDKGLNPFTWYCSARVNYFRKGKMDPEFLAYCHDNGLRRISLGVESGSNRILEYLRKEIKAEDVIRAATWLEASKIRPSYNFMIGLPKEDAQDIRDTIQLVHRLSEIHSSWAIVGPQLFRPYPGSTVYDDCMAPEGSRAPASIDEWIQVMLEDARLLDPRKMLWIQEPEMVSVVHFYSALIAASYPKLVLLILEYCRMTEQNWLFKTFAVPGVVVLSAVAKGRLKTGFFKFFFEKIIFDRMRRRHLSF